MSIPLSVTNELEYHPQVECEDDQLNPNPIRFTYYDQSFDPTEQYSEESFPINLEVAYYLYSEYASEGNVVFRIPENEDDYEARYIGVGFPISDGVPARMDQVAIALVDLAYMATLEEDLVTSIFAEIAQSQILNPIFDTIRADGTRYLADEHAMVNIIHHVEERFTGAQEILNDPEKYFTMHYNLGREVYRNSEINTAAHMARYIDNVIFFFEQNLLEEAQMLKEGISILRPTVQINFGDTTGRFIIRDNSEGIPVGREIIGIVGELANNSRKYGTHDGFALTYVNIYKDDEFGLVDISDFGIGVNMEEFERLFLLTGEDGRGSNTGREGTGNGLVEIQDLVSQIEGASIEFIARDHTNQVICFRNSKGQGFYISEAEVKVDDTGRYWDSEENGRVDLPRRTYKEKSIARDNEYLSAGDKKGVDIASFRAILKFPTDKKI